MNEIHLMMVLGSWIGRIASWLINFRSFAFLDRGNGIEEAKFIKIR
jgi:hypothetical protein